MAESRAADSTAARKLVLASGNPGKLRELGSILRPLGWDIRLQAEWKLSEAVEDGATFVENALIKARHAAHFTGLPSLADDSGLVVDALHGVPGIFSSRYAGERADATDNNLKLLEALKDTPDIERSAHFYCAIVLLRHERDPAPLIATGRWEGRILRAVRGSGGFGYDPLFWLEDRQCTSAELQPGVKNRISHRGQALAALLAELSADQQEEL
jgi:XTP/dITP diphosphohydrolase